MTKRLSFTKEEHGIRSEFREMMDQAESTEDVKKFFFQTAQGLLNRITDEELNISFEDVGLDLKRREGYVLSPALMNQAGLEEIKDGSDLGHILERMATQAWNRYRRLDKNPAKTEKKIYPRPSSRQRAARL